MKDISSITIRPIEERDKGAYMRLFQSEDFGCIGINSDLKPSIFAEERIVSGVIDKSIISTAILVIEDNGEFIGYTSITRSSEHRYHIGQFVVRHDKQGQGYGKTLMQEVKRYAAHDNCDIALECISRANVFFEKQGFKKEYLSSYLYSQQTTVLEKKESLFVDYELIKQESEERDRQSQESFQKFLQSSLFKDIMKI